MDNIDDLLQDCLIQSDINLQNIDNINFDSVLPEQTVNDDILIELKVLNDTSTHIKTSLDILLGYVREMSVNVATGTKILLVDENDDIKIPITFDINCKGTELSVPLFKPTEISLPFKKKEVKKRTIIKIPTKMLDGVPVDLVKSNKRKSDLNEARTNKHIKRNKLIGKGKKDLYFK